MYPHVTQFETIDNRVRASLTATAEAPRRGRAGRRKRLLVRTPKVTCEP